MCVSLGLSMIGHVIFAAIDVERQKGVAYMAIFMTIGVKDPHFLTSFWIIFYLLIISAGLPHQPYWRHLDGF